MIEVFKTNIHSKKIADQIRKCLEEAFPGHSINFDLEDRDKILRIEAESLDCEKVMEMVKCNDIAITILED